MGPSIPSSFVRRATVAAGVVAFAILAGGSYGDSRECGARSGAKAKATINTYPAWDGAKATGTAVFESPPKTISYSDKLFHNVSFDVSSAKVNPGLLYVVFASIDKDFESCTANYIRRWGAVVDTAYAGGSCVLQNNLGDESQWTSTPWTIFPNDLVTKVFLTK